MAMGQDEIEKKVMEHDFEFKSIGSSLTSVVDELHKITGAMKDVALLANNFSNMNQKVDEAFDRVHAETKENKLKIEKLEDMGTHEGCPALKLKSTEIDIVNRAVFGKDGRGGLVYDVADIKKFMYKLFGFFTAINVVIAGLTYFKG